MKHLYKMMLGEAKKRFFYLYYVLNLSVTFGSVGQLFLTGKTQN